MRAAALIVSAALLAAPASPQSRLTEAPDRGVSFEENVCDVPGALDVDLYCGHLVVPEDYSDPGGLRLRLPALRIGPLDPERMALLLGGGGPGAGAARLTPFTVLFWGLFQRNVLGGRGLLVVDQRGTGTDNHLRCPGLVEEAEWVLAHDLSAEEELGFHNVFAGSCLEHFERQGVDLLRYTTRDSARDYENLRRAVGVRSLDLVGVSYSSVIAFEMIRSYPESVRSAVLDSPLIPEPESTPYETNFDRLFDRLASECLAEPECANVYGDMRSNVKVAMRRLESRPLSLPYPYWETLPDDEEPVFVLNRSRMPLTVLYAFYDLDLIASMPAYLRDLALLGTSALAPRYARNLAEFYRLEGMADGLYNTIVCREQAPFEAEISPPVTGIEWVDPAAEGYWDGFCEEVWPVGPPIPPFLPEGFPHPVLMLSGTLDPITPAGAAAGAVSRFPAAQHVTVPGTHGVLGTRCGDFAAREFLLDPRAPVLLPEPCTAAERWWK